MLQHLPRTTASLSAAQPWMLPQLQQSHGQHHASSATALHLGIGGSPLEGEAIRSGGSWLLASLGQAGLPALSISGFVLLLLWMEVRFHSGNHAQKMMTDMVEHRREKSKTLRSLFRPMVAIMASVGMIALATGQSAWAGGPSASQLGASIGFWTSLICLDNAMDECAPAKPKATMAATMMMSLFLIFKLATSTGKGHVIFTLRAIEVVTGTVLAGTVDTGLWAVVAGAVMGLIGASAIMGWLPALPAGVSLAGMGSFTLVSIFGSSLYQISQRVHSAPGKTANVRVYRSGLNAVAVLWGLPPSWSLYCACHAIIFFGLKVLVDSVGIHAAKACLRSGERQEFSAAESPLVMPAAT